ncbi:MAG: hypothetical protein M1831_006773 [Alyxoria varia]|nr:MAG: hypothetical protein M1831_006773 [Alyxoria varia]
MSESGDPPRKAPKPPIRSSESLLSTGSRAAFNSSESKPTILNAYTISKDQTDRVDLAHEKLIALANPHSPQEDVPRLNRGTYKPDLGIPIPAPYSRDKAYAHSGNESGYSTSSPTDNEGLEGFEAFSHMRGSSRSYDEKKRLESRRNRKGPDRKVRRNHSLAALSYNEHHTPPEDDPENFKSSESLAAELMDLQQENQALKNLVKANEATAEVSALTKPPRWQVVHYVNHQGHFAAPQWVKGEDSHNVARASLPLRNTDLYLERNKDVGFFINKSYRESFNETNEAPIPSAESIRIVHPAAMTALDQFFDRIPGFDEVFPNFKVDDPIPAPYLCFWYCLRIAKSADLEPGQAYSEWIKLTLEYVRSTHESEYQEVARCFTLGCLAPNLMHYLIRPQQIIVSRHSGKLQAYKSISWIHPVSSSEDLGDSSTDHSQKEAQWEVECWAWSFDGQFRKVYETLTIDLKNIELDNQGLFQVSTLEVYPMEFAPTHVRDTIHERVNRFWKCNKKNFVSLRPYESQLANTVLERYMIDTATKNKLHPSTSVFSLKKASEPTQLEQLPEGDEKLLFPPELDGFNMRQKKWVTVKVDEICDVEWNKSAFSNLVIDPEMKELIKALVTSQIASEKGTDMISNKGNGLIMLLHGGPGTGKTFTAESVAELAEKPLYRVTCGDIGTNPEGVEKYLESVLHLGKIWDCVVLLDEAEVFLEQRSLADLQRNALVSVFLRVIEYYDGILILTSNRVGTFDEAFKSRIQLALHYENLGPAQRRKVWRNFFTHLKSFDRQAENQEGDARSEDKTDSDIDIDDLVDHIDELGKEEMNGRQIRNAITTGRQLAQYNKQKFGYNHLKRAIAVTGQFDKYLQSVNEGYSHDQIAREDRLR